MFCTNCGEKLEEDAKFCTNCGATVEEQKEEPKKDIVNEVMNKRKEAIEHKYDAKANDTTGVKINGKEVKIEKTTNTNTNTSNSNNKKSNTALIVIIIVGSILLIGALGIASVFIYKDFLIPKTTKVESTRNTKVPSGNKTESGWEISYKIPNEFEGKSYSTNTLKMYNYSKDGSMCSLTIWKITYIKDGETEESLLREYSNSSKKDTIDVKNIKINGKTWKYLEDKGHWSNYEYGRFSNDKTNFYLIKYKDYDPDTGVCKKYLDEVIKSITYNK